MASRKRKTDEGLIYQLKVTLIDSRPPIWRRLQVSANTSLEHLHWIVQTAFGWTNSHLHQFIIDRQYYSLPEFELDDYNGKVGNETRTKLSQLRLKPKMKFIYEYDFGDSWIHEILVEKVLDREEGISYPICIGGKRAGPPEDCGGIWGYERMLEVIKDPDDPEHEDMMEWLGGSFDPEYFNQEEVNEQMK
jgi:hypothetical protein